MNMERKRKVLTAEDTSWFKQTIDEMPEDSKIFVDKSMEIAGYIISVMERKGLRQKDLAEKMGKTEAEISKWLSGMHNFTLRSLAKIEAALGSKIMFIPAKVNTPAITSRGKLESKTAEVIRIEPKLNYVKSKVIHMEDRCASDPDNQLE